MQCSAVVQRGAVRRGSLEHLSVLMLCHARCAIELLGTRVRVT